MLKISRISSVTSVKEPFALAKQCDLDLGLVHHQRPRKTTTNMELDFITTIVHKAGTAAQDSGAGLCGRAPYGTQQLYKVMSPDTPLIIDQCSPRRQDVAMTPMQTGKLLQSTAVSDRGGCHCYDWSTRGYFKLYLGAMGWYPSLQCLHGDLTTSVIWPHSLNLGILSNEAIICRDTTELSELPCFWYSTNIIIQAKLNGLMRPK